jgi:hypothetical protein
MMRTKATRITGVIAAAVAGLAALSACQPDPTAGVTTTWRGSTATFTLTAPGTVRLRCGTNGALTVNGVATGPTCAAAATIRVVGSSGADTIDVDLRARRIDLGISAGGGADDVTFRIAQQSNATVEGGAGDDTITDTSGTSASASQGSVAIDTGTGTDTVRSATGNVTDYVLTTTDTVQWASRTRFVSVTGSSAAETATITVATTAGPKVRVTGGTRTFAADLPLSTENLTLALGGGNDRATIAGRGAVEVWAYGGTGTNTMTFKPSGAATHAVDPGPLHVLLQPPNGTWYAQQFGSVTVA